MDEAMDMDGHVFGFCYNMAMLDATRRTAVASRKDAYLGNGGMRDAVESYVDRIFAHPEKVDAKHAIEEVREASGDKSFTIGNAQKLVNMTAKYLYIATYGNDALRRNFRLCDCPMDKTMVDKVIKMMVGLEGSFSSDDRYAELTKTRLDREGKTVKWTVFLRQPWSKMGTGHGSEGDGKWEQYDLFQDIVKFLIVEVPGIASTPIEFDYVNFY